jgi:N-acetylglucosamine malate deacetylase 1
MKQKRIQNAVLAIFVVSGLFVGQMASAETDANAVKLRIIVFGAHPDDCEYDAGGVAIMWARQGYHVKFVSTTNGDVGHATLAGGPLAKRRIEEAKKADAILGVESLVLDNHDGELMPTLENRKTIIRLIREWKADIVIAPRPYDYHPDHRYTGILVQDAAFMVMVPHLCPDVPQLNRNPVFLYSSDGFRKPNAFEPDVIVPTDDVIETKADALWQMESQVESFWATGNFEKVVSVPKQGEERKEYEKKAKEKIKSRDSVTADRHRAKLIETYGQEKGSTVKYAEAFELCEYGRQPGKEDLRKMFGIGK